MTSPRRRSFRVFILTAFILGVVQSSESSVTTSESENDDNKIVDVTAIDVGAGDAGNHIIEGETPSSTDAKNDETTERGEIIIDADNDDVVVDGNQLQYAPPTHFQITAHVQTDLRTGLSYFLPKESHLPDSFAHLPYLECGAVGSTTEGLPLVSGVFRHVPHTAVVPKREDLDVVLENLEGVDEEDASQAEAKAETGNLEGLDLPDDDKSNGTGHNGESDHPKRPSPPKYVVALSSMEITVGGNGNETHKFEAGDVIFIEDTWWGIWDDDSEKKGGNNGDGKLSDNGDNVEDASTEQQTDTGKDETRMKGYVMRASPESQTDLNVLMLTVPNTIHRHWKNAQYAMAMSKRETEEAQQREQSPRHTPDKNLNEFGIRRPWWKPRAFSKQQYSSMALPKPCSLESDPAFAHPLSSSSTLSQHFTQHFTGLLRRSSNPHPSFLPHHHQDLLLPIIAQTAAAAVGGATALALVLQLWRVVPGPVALGFGSACLLGLGTWGIVWLGEEVLDQWELWRERRRLERMMSEGWGRGGGASTMMGDIGNGI